MSSLEHAYRFELGDTGLVDINKPMGIFSNKILNRATNSFRVTISEYVASETTYKTFKVADILFGELYTEKRWAELEAHHSNAAVKAISEHFEMNDNDSLLLLSFTMDASHDYGDDVRCNVSVYNILVNLANKRMIRTMCPVDINYIAISTDREFSVDGYINAGDGLYIAQVK